jgi:hypothetical protein
MALKLSVSQAREADKGNPFPGLIGKVKVVFTQKEKESKNPNAAPGSIYLDQGVVLCDQSDPKQEIVVSFYDRAAFGKDITGQVMEITPGPKGGLKSNGSYEKEYNGNSQTVYTATVTAACEVTFGGGAAPAAAPARPAAASQPGRPAPAAPQAPAPRPPAPAAVHQGNLSWAEYLQIEGEIMTRCLQTSAAILAKNAEAIAALTGVGPEPAQVVELAIGLRMGGAKVGLTHDSRFDLPGRTTINPPAALAPEDPGQGPEAEDSVPF